MALTNDEAELTRKAKTRESQTSSKCDDAGERKELIFRETAKWNLLNGNASKKLYIKRSGMTCHVDAKMRHVI
jgi:hypothetical protein